MIRDALILVGLAALSAGVAMRFGIDAGLMVGGVVVLALGLFMSSAVAK